MAIQWTNNSNDTQSTDSVQAVLSGYHAASVSVITVASVADAGSERAHWANGHEFNIAGDSTLYSITSAGKLADLMASWVVSPVLALSAATGTVVSKEGGGSVGYKGNQGSAENHLRLRNQGQI